MRETLEGDPPVELWLFDKNYQRMGPVPAPEAVEWLGLWPGLGSGWGQLVFTVAGNNPRMAKLTTPGARVVCTLNRPGYTEPKILISGPVNELKGLSLGHATATRTFTVADDADDVFHGIVGWPVPAAAITAQGASAYHEITGPASDVVRSAVLANAPRQGVPVSVGSALGLGLTTTVRIRMHPLADQLFPRVSNLSVGVRVVQDPDESVRRLIMWVPPTRKMLTEESGVILPGAELTVQAPSATRIIVAAGGEGTARVFRQYIDAAAESKWGVSRSVVVDARDVAPTDPNLATILQERADEALAENAETTSLKVELTETNAWQYGVAWELGDKVPIKLAGEDVITDRIKEVQMSFNKDDGLSITPRVGNFEESQDDRLYRLVARALKTNRNLEVTR